MKDTIHTLASNFFVKLGVDYSNLETNEEALNIYRISVKSEDSHLLIGPHGKNLEMLNYLLRLLVSKNCEIKEHVTIHLEVNDYLEQKDKKLISFIETKLKYVKESGKEIILPFFTAYERKKVHSFVSDNGGNVFTESQGEGKDRRIHLCRKDERMTIDIDGDDI